MKSWSWVALTDSLVCASFVPRRGVIGRHLLKRVALGVNEVGPEGYLIIGRVGCQWHRCATMSTDPPGAWGWTVWYRQGFGAVPAHYGLAAGSAWRYLETMFCLGRSPWLEWNIPCGR